MNGSESSAPSTSAYRVLIGCTGSVASIKIPDIVTSLIDRIPQIEIKVVTTEHAQHFFDKSAVPVPVYTDEDEWKWQSRGDPVLHIELRRWADLLVIAPLDANTLAKIAGGLCDNLLTCIVRAWDLKRPLLCAPAMNTLMWDHPLTAEHITKIETLGIQIIPTVEKLLMCGDKGHGGMAAVSTIVDCIHDQLLVCKKTDPPI